MCEQILGGRGLGVRRFTRSATVAVSPSLAHSSAAFTTPIQEDHVEDVPRSSTMDRRVVVEWGLEKSRL